MMTILRKIIAALIVVSALLLGGLIGFGLLYAFYNVFPFRPKAGEANITYWAIAIGWMILGIWIIYKYRHLNAKPLLDSEMPLFSTEAFELYTKYAVGGMGGAFTMFNANGIVALVLLLAQSLILHQP